MIKIENVSVVGWRGTLRGMRNPMNSWDRSDSGTCGDFPSCGPDCPKWSPDHYCGYSEHLENDPHDYFMIGPKDLELMQRLVKAGTEHAKFRRMIIVYCDITAPLYWWKEFDTYKVGTVANSCSTMHKIAEKEFVLDDFSHEHLISFLDIDDIYEDTDIEEPAVVKMEAGIYPFHIEGSTMPAYAKDWLKETCKILNAARNRYLETKDKKYWWQLIQLLPTSYNQKRTVMMNYEVLSNIYRQRKNHKLDEWHAFCDWIETLPYAEEILCGKES